ncbi:exopolysaccharide biosynthesis polyprenyl glycosylphosphotransferase [Confluentibacter sediminis]|uniref:exopolysaccharide biosynthesis polyprenyl glycosylphosphotransferase n=1 Tax=Confluentibacter sediminis TaxID=2219045 RepID=UPI000DAC414B|nr:exopolysaccharide biosynthesis polyprenyl glycosylphosphotransferase [Confluentibacter sediminis]
MNTIKKERNSDYIKPISYLIDLGVINGSIFLFETFITDTYLFSIYISFLWIIISFKNNFYDVQRYTRVLQIVTLILVQFVFYGLILYAFIGFFKQPYISRLALGNYFLFVLAVISFLKFLLYFVLNKYRSKQLGNYRNVVVIGNTEKTRQLIYIFNKKLDYGYKFKKQFTLEEEDFSLQKCFKFIIENDIDEIYTSVAELSNKQINRIIDFADNNLKELKFIPDNKDIYSKKLKYEYYDYIPILSLRRIPIQEPVNKAVKRIFDILISLFIVVFILSWLIPILGLLIVIESKGPIFFRQDRPGIKEKGFGCYKFRSMAINSTTEKSASRNDARVTRIGRFIRKTSIDELPQFFNVLFGHMSVVGPRPHLWKQNEMYGTTISKYMVRYFVKPGITGLAQIKGYRGEIETKEDIINRTKYDIFYIENWSLLMDLNIIIQTAVNIFKGEDKAY